MIAGFNTNVEFSGRVYHVQTEAMKGSRAIVESLVYHRGSIVHSMRTSCAHLLAAEASEQLITRMVEAQHRRMLQSIKAGRIGENNALLTEVDRTFSTLTQAERSSPKVDPAPAAVSELPAKESLPAEESTPPADQANGGSAAHPRIPKPFDFQGGFLQKMEQQARKFKVTGSLWTNGPVSPLNSGLATILGDIANSSPELLLTGAIADRKLILPDNLPAQLNPDLSERFAEITPAWQEFTRTIDQLDPVDEILVRTREYSFLAVKISARLILVGIVSGETDLRRLRATLQSYRNHIE